MIELRWETDIRASALAVFALLANLRDYDRWLPRSSSFNGTTTISEGPIGVGSTYVEPGPLGTRFGRITAYVYPTRIDFEQPMYMRPAFLGVVGIKLFHTLTPGPETVHLVRTLQVTPQGFAKLLMPFAKGAFKAENERMIATLKAVAEREAREV